MKRSKFVALLMVSVMVCMAAQPAFAGWSGNDYVREQTETLIDVAKLGKAGEVIEGAYNIYETGTNLYNAKDNSERLDIVVDAASDYAKAGVKTVVDSTIATSATSTAVYIASAAGMTAKTGTAIATLSGAAATNATLCAIGTPVATALGITAAPAVVGGAIVAGGAALVCYGVHKFIDWIW